MRWMRRRRGRRSRGERCPCGSGRSPTECCGGLGAFGLTGLGMVGSTQGGSFLLTLGLPGIPGTEVHEGIEALTPERQKELEAAFARMAHRSPGDPCEICALQQRWREEDRRRAEAG